MGLIIVDLDLPQGELLALQRPGRAVLSVCEAAPTTLPAESVVLVAGEGRLTLATPADGKPWARSFELTTVDGAPVLVPGGEAPVASIWKPQPVTVPAPVAKEPQPELPIASKVVVLIGRGEVSADVRSKWTVDGFVVVQRESDALPQPGEIEGGLREIVVAGEDQRTEELKARATRLHWAAVERGVDSVVTIRVAA
ncbi:MAG: hypothetical protein EKK29_18270 [Hyphomicrobiales bacterium]|nr:MAG: hypothetical protein EKK29_18270 [Hyphomicrobiales bacterium]